jgi:hypothetical protein
MRSPLKLLTLIAITSAILMGSATATPPNAIHAKYDSKRQELLVKVEHQSSRYLDHFIERVDITKNGVAVATETFTLQTSHRNQTMPPIKFSAKPGDIIGITAICNSGKKMISEIKVR